jgi:NDP-sugar pyrophosphorylase family protein
MNKKFRSIGEPLSKDLKLYQIQALKDFGDVKAGDLGGWIESEYNLSDEGNCWIYDNSTVMGSAQIYENATVRGLCYIDNKVMVHGNARLRNVTAYDNVEIYGNSQINGKVLLCDYVKIYMEMLMLVEE